MSFNAKQFYELVDGTLRKFDSGIPYSPAATKLLLLTSAQESGLGTYIKQTVGPAQGVFQIEPRSHAELWRRLVAKNKDNIIKAILEIAWHTTCTDEALATVKREIAADTAYANKFLPHLQANLLYQILMARVYYYMVPAPLPSEDVAEMAKYWKQYYNTPLGKGTVEEAKINYQKYVASKGV